MSIENTKIIPITYYEKDETAPVRVTRRGKIAAAALTSMAALGVGYAAHEVTTPDFHGEHTATIHETTVTGIAEDNVKNASSDIQGIVQKIVDMNPDVFQNGQPVVEGNDVGKEINVPDSVDK